MMEVFATFQLLFSVLCLSRLKDFSSAPLSLLLIPVLNFLQLTSFLSHVPVCFKSLGPPLSLLPALLLSHCLLLD